MKALSKDRSVVGWVLYDWANSSFALTAMALFFPIFFKTWWNAGVAESLSTARLGFGHALAGLLIALCSPLLGAMADVRFGKKRLLVLFMLLGACCTGALALVAQPLWLVALVVFMLARVGFSLANIFYDALLGDVAGPGQLHRVSSWGYGMGYLGCGLLGVVNVVMVSAPQWFGLASKADAVRWSFVSVCVWWIVFSLPLMVWVRERPPVGRGSTLALMGESVRAMVATGRSIGRRRELLLFLIAFWLYHDGVHAFVMMATDFGLSIGIEAKGLMVALLVVQFVAFPAALVFGWLANRIGAKRSILIAIAIYVVVCLLGAALLKTQLHFMLLAALTGSAQGAIQALSRSLFASLVPAEKAGEYFGFYNMIGKFSMVLGPAIVGGVGLAAVKLGVDTQLAPRLGIGSLSLLFIGGGVLLWLVRLPSAVEELAAAQTA
jgi:UMF1 family MFS transporter